MQEYTAVRVITRQRTPTKRKRNRHRIYWEVIEDGIEDPNCTVALLILNKDTGASKNNKPWTHIHQGTKIYKIRQSGPVRKSPRLWFVTNKGGKK